MNVLSHVLTRTNLEILSLVSEGEFSLREIAEKLNCSPGKVHQAIQIFKQNSLVITERVKNKLIIKSNRKSAVYQKVKSLVNIDNIVKSKNYNKLKSTGIIGVYGSYAQGTDDKESDIDLVILTEKKELLVRERIRSLEKELGKRISPLFITKQKIKNLEKEDKEFYIRLKLTTIELNGDIFG